jgi:cytidine deaminase
MASSIPKAIRASFNLVDDAIKAASSAYAVYSDFFVGAAVQCASGKVYLGCNVENSSYPLGVCAEASAISAARVAEGHAMKILTIAVYARKAPPRRQGETTLEQFNRGEQAPCSPCGGCRQRIAEFGSDIEVIFSGSGLQQINLPIKELLPYTFSFEKTARR